MQAGEGLPLGRRQLAGRMQKPRVGKGFEEARACGFAEEHLDGSDQTGEGWGVKCRQSREKDQSPKLPPGKNHGQLGPV